MIDEIFVFLEVIFELFIFVLMILSFFYYFSAFIEERMKTITKIIKGLNIIILGLSLLLLFSNLSIYLCVSIIVSNLLWLYILFTNYPYINLSSPSFLLSVLATIISHSVMMMHFIKYDEVSSITTASYFVLYVWTLPILIIVSIDALASDDYIEEDINENEIHSNQKSHSYMRLIFANLISKASEFLPHNTDKKD